MTVDWQALKIAGFSCFPLKARDKRPFGAWEAYQSRHPTEAELGGWAKRPTLNGAIVCGAISMIIVLDTDSREAEAEVQRRGIPATVMARTAKGRHIYFRHPGFEVKNFVRKLPGCDLRGDGGYVVAPGSIHPTGAVYQWIRSPAEAAILEAPTWLLELIRPASDQPPVTPVPPPSGARSVTWRDAAPGVSSYAEKAFDNEMIALRRAGEGTRNDTLNRAAFNLGTLIGAGLLVRSTVERHLLSAALAIGLSEKEAYTTIKSGIETGISEPRHVEERRPPAAARPAREAGTPVQSGGGGEDGPPTDGDAAPDDRALADEPRNDYGNARRLIARHGPDMVFVDEAGWYVFDGRRMVPPLAKWAPEAQKRAHLTAQAILEEARALEPMVRDAETELARRHAASYGREAIKEAEDALKAAQDRTAAHFRFATTSGNAGKIAAMLSEAGPYCRRAAADLDRNPFLFNLGNGTLKLGRRPKPPETTVTVSLRPHDRADLITHLSPVDYNAEAVAPQWHKFLERVQPSDEMRKFLQALAGYCVTGDTGEQVMALFHGKGANGKSTFLKLIQAALGDYALTLPIQTFLADDRRGAGDATPDLARLPGARLVVASEPEKGARLSESIVKSMTGGDKVVARRLFEGQFEFDPVFKLILSANEKPRIAGHDEGIWRRVLLVPWLVEIPFAERDRRLAQRLQRELPGILNWIVEGYRLWRAEGLVIPESISDATKEYREQSDPIGQFIETCVRHEAEATLGASLLHEVYAHWSRSNGVGKPWSQQAFGRYLSDHGYRRIGNCPVLYQDVFWTADGHSLLDEVNAAKAKRREIGGLEDVGGGRVRQTEDYVHNGESE
jgi:putative DNA primase/helicase